MRPSPLTTICGLAFGLVSILPSAARPAETGRWPRFRGPNGAGISHATTVPVRWSADDCNWRVKLPGGGHSSPVVWDGRVFVTCTDARTARRTVLCLTAGDGREMWRKDFPGRPHRMHRDNSYASATPAVDEKGVYLAWATPREVTLLSLDHAGRDRWRRGLGAFDSMHGHGTSPIAVGGLVVLANDQRGTASLIAVDRQTGKTRWQAERRSGLTPASTPCVFRAAGLPPRLIFTTTAHGISAVDPNTGQTDWELPKVFLDRCVGSPVFDRGRVVASYGYGQRGTRLVAARPGEKARGVEPKIAWDLKKSVPLVPTPIAKDGRLFLWSDDGTTAAMEIETGKLLWRQRVEGSFYGSPVWVDGRLYCISKKGEVVVLAAADAFRQLARVPLGEKSFATPAVAGGVMYLRTWSHLLAVGGDEGR